MARSFDGSTQFEGTTTARVPGVRGTGAYTVSAWANPASTSAGSHNVFHSGAVADYTVQLRRDAGDWNIFSKQGVPSGDINASFAGGVSAGSWVHLAGT